jgi:four helix bundle protein
MAESESAGVPAPDIRERTLEYGLRAVKLYRALRKGRDGAGRVIATQFLRAATSVGANVAESQAAESRADFIHKYSIAQKEARESLYWLRLMAKANVMPAQRLADLVRETEELVAIITTILVHTKDGTG